MTLDNFLKKEHTAILVIDMQPGFLRDIQDAKKILTIQENLIDTYSQIPLFVAKYQPFLFGNTHRKIRKKIKQRNSFHFKKPDSSAFSNNVFMEKLEEQHIQNLLLMGVNKSICIYETAFDALQRGIQVCVGNEYVQNNYHISSEYESFVAKRNEWLRKNTIYIP